MAYYDNGQHNGGQFGYGYHGSGLYGGNGNGQEDPPTAAPEIQTGVIPSPAEKKRIRKLYNCVGGALLSQYILTYIIVIFAFIFFGRIFTARTDPETGSRIVGAAEALVMFCAPASASIIIFIIYYALRGLKPSSCFGTSEIKRPFLIKMLLVSLFLHQAGILLEYAVYFSLTAAGYDTPELNYELASDLPTSIINIFTSVILAPVAEELFFRGLVLKETARVSGRFALVFSSVIFGLMHGNPYQAVMAALLGFGFGYAALKTRSLIPPILCHMTVNTAASITDIASYISPSLEEPVYGIILLIEFAAGLMGVIWLIKTDGIKLPSYTKYHKKRTVPIMLTSVFVIIAIAVYIYDIVNCVQPIENTEDLHEIYAKIISFVKFIKWK